MTKRREKLRNPLFKPRLNDPMLNTNTFPCTCSALCHERRNHLRTNFYITKRPNTFKIPFKWKFRTKFRQKFFNKFFCWSPKSSPWWTARRHLENECAWTKIVLMLHRHISKSKNIMSFQTEKSVLLYRFVCPLFVRSFYTKFSHYDCLTCKLKQSARNYLHHDLCKRVLNNLSLHFFIMTTERETCNMLFDLSTTNQIFLCAHLFHFQSIDLFGSLVQEQWDLEWTNRWN